jgi:hypothetical protein
VKISKVTMTGADHTIAPQCLISISEAYPCVEWGILRSRSQNGWYRFPSKKLLAAFAALKTPEMNTCAHLCGKYVREVVEGGEFKWFSEAAECSEIFNRIQLNFHAETHTPHPNFYQTLKNSAKHSYIFQMDGFNEHLFHGAKASGVNVSPLFDLSGGAGILPSNWPIPIAGVACGYAGGLGPENIVDELKRIEDVVGDREIWIDMETRIRCDSDDFDLRKVVKCLQLSDPYIVKTENRGKAECIY